VLLARKARAHDKWGISPCGRRGHFNQLPQAIQKNATREMLPAEECCGFGGTFSVKFSELSGAMARTKLEAIIGTGAKTVVSLDPSCLMQIQGAISRAGLNLRTMHLAEVLASR